MDGGRNERQRSEAEGVVKPAEERKSKKSARKYSEEYHHGEIMAKMQYRNGGRQRAYQHNGEIM